MLKKLLSIPLKFHWSFILLPIMFFYITGFNFLNTIYFLTLIASLLCHEYGHVWMAQRKNIYVSHVILHGFGAAALIANMKPKQELSIASAGPAVSLCLGIFFLTLFFITSISIMGIIGTMNILLGTFNLLPIYPADGGRILYSILSRKLGVKKGINYAVGVACVLAGILGLIGIFYGAINLLILSILLVVLSFHQRTQLLKIQL